MAPRKKIPEAEQTTKQIPSAEQQTKEIPSAQQQVKPIPEPTKEFKELPKVGNPENTVIIGGKLIQIKATKLKYQRNRTAQFYRILDLYPLGDVLAMGAGQFGDDRDGDKAVMDWLIAVTDDEQLIVDNYDDMDTTVIEKLVQIYKRVNKVTQKESKLKNMMRTQETE